MFNLEPMTEQNKKKTYLLSDDDQDIRTTVLCDALSQKGYQVRSRKMVIPHQMWLHLRGGIRDWV